MFSFTSTIERTSVDFKATLLFLLTLIISKESAKLRKIR
jgi:hypothetical protein